MTDKQDMAWVYKKNRWHNVYMTEGQTDIRPVVITPDLAREWLENRNKENRSMKKNQVTRIARDIRSGNWHDTGDYISFYRDGQIANGQNRLAAIVESKTSIRTKVAFGIDRAAKMFIDTGKSRSLSDRSKLSGNNFSSKELQTAKFILEQDPDRSGLVFDDEVISFLRRHGDIVETVCSTVSSRYIDKQPARAGIAYVWLEDPKHEAELREFAVKYNDGVGIESEDSPVKRLRDFALEQRQSNSGPYREELFRKTIAAARHFVSRNKVKRLYAAKADSIKVSKIFGRRK